VRNLLLFAHVAGAIVFLGPTTAATSRFARHAASADLGAAADAGRTSRAYGTASVVVPGVGFVLAERIEALGQPWVQAAIALFVVGGILLAAGHLPAQRRALDRLRAGEPVPRALLGRLRATAGAYAVTWFVVAWLMVAKPT
jgi:uncharacterized membrane protein